MGVGDSLEAEFTLVGPLPAGTWRLVGDGIIIEPVDVRFEILWRSDAGDQVLATFEHHFDPQPDGSFDAVLYEDTREAPAAPARPGDELVLRYTAVQASGSISYVPNGDGARYKGRIPFIELPR